MSYIPIKYQKDLKDLKNFDYYCNNISGILFTFVLYDKEIDTSDLIFDQIDINSKNKYYFEYNDTVILKVVNDIKYTKLKTKKENLIEKLKKMQEKINNYQNEDQSENEETDDDDNDGDNNNNNLILKMDKHINYLKILSKKIENLKSTNSERIKILSNLNKDLKIYDIYSIKKNKSKQFSITVPNKDIWYGGIIRKIRKSKQTIGNKIKKNNIYNLNFI